MRILLRCFKGENEKSPELLQVRGFLCMARSGGFEPPTAWFVARYSIQLSYERVVVVANYSDLPWLRQLFFKETF